ncbi:transmembrane protein-like protein [Thalictrum thalictroides]|uniref:Transmembrane protein-like protein n=1 Tax=Thalictrum thalictroides TaxID=46969 RepID=A0A7J6WK92_THATH|nr:transmembrane protein-like protein [Thalictrum thalictroides]
MGKKFQNLSSLLNLLHILLCFSWLPIITFSYTSSVKELGLNDNNIPITLSSFHYSKSTLGPYSWRYIRVDLPLGFASLSMNLESDVDIDTGTVKKLPKSKLHIICFRDGGPPLPDASNIALTVLSTPANHSIVDIQLLQLVEHCHPLQENTVLMLTNEQISSGALYIGLFNGFGSASTQSKMIIRGSDFSFSTNISVEGCPTSGMWGQYCNQTVVSLSCVQSDVSTSLKNHPDTDMYNQTAEKITTCRNSFEASCAGYREPRGYSLDVPGMVEELKMMTVNVSLNEKSFRNNTGNVSGVLYARYGAMPSGSLYDFSIDINKTPLVIPSPKVGRWYVSLLPGKQTQGRLPMEDNDINSDLCYSLEWQVRECPVGKAGPNCTWESHMLETVMSKNPSLPFESYYWPIGETISLASSKFLLEPLLSKSSFGEYAWTYFVLDIPHGAAGGNIHVQLSSDDVLNYEIYSRVGGLPSLNSWDYYYSNKTSSSNGSIFFKLYDASEYAVNFYILYPKEGTWSFGLRHPVHSAGSSKHQTFMSIHSERCPNGCSSPHGTCHNSMDASGLTLYSYCFCDRDHGGFDCSIEIVSRKGHIWHSIALIASNGAAILPAFWTLRHKAFAEWVLFTSSGISSGLYHACDVGTWCALSFHVLQFMDFWLSFMAVVSTFVHLANIDEVSKRVIHTIVAILTALMAATGATRSSNIILVIVIGASGLVIGWLIESSATIRSISFSTMFSLNFTDRLHSIKDRLYNFVKTLRSRFRWGYILIGVVTISLAGLSWKMETDESYWIWHSLWHVTIYTSSFFFLCAKVTTVDTSTQDGHNVTYELTRQDSSSRV